MVGEIGRTGDAPYSAIITARIERDGPAYGPTALVLSPTRDQAIRVHESIFQMTSRGTTARIAAAFEGKPFTSQIGPLKHGSDIVIGTPGRVAEHVKKRTLRIEQLKILVLDRADEMLESGAAQEIEGVFEVTPRTRQTIVLSTTAPPRLLTLARRRLSDPVLTGIDRDAYEATPVPGEIEERTANLYFGLGKAAGITPRDLAGVLINEGGLDRDRVGVIKIKQNFSLVAVPADELKGLVKRLKSTQVKGRKTKIRPERF